MSKSECWALNSTLPQVQLNQKLRRPRGAPLPVTGEPVIQTLVGKKQSNKPQVLPTLHAEANDGHLWRGGGEVTVREGQQNLGSKKGGGKRGPPCVQDYQSPKQNPQRNGAQEKH